ncbi:TniQ family protein [Roseicyclus sp. F158]|uniref:TniQ family protein n=1 Tax=Tropicimonas omnivorans TaxID=3075590 RepID=A0ABU3DHB0_9RHOB|nr:TniQ family protein [Roseicyclus sp. F158]MDT0683107.1 TniQ family protein [Roseicyclus sp. F158]
MPVLFPHLQCHADETPLSFSARLAAFHIDKPLVPFLHDIGVQPDALALGNTDAVNRLAAIAGVDPAVLSRNAMRSTAKDDYVLRGHELSAEMLSRPDTTFCPACLLEDDADATDVAVFRRQRLAWTLRPVRTCARHGLSLVRRRVKGHDRKYFELARHVPERGDDLRHLIDGCTQRSPSRLQGYVLSRLDGVAGPAWLDSQALKQAIKTSEFVGALVAFGPSAKASELSQDQWDEAGRIGFEVTSEGEAGIQRALHEAQNAFKRTGAVPGRRKMYGMLWEWLSATKLRKAPGDIARIMREHIFETMAIGSGEVILGEALPERRLHSVQSLARESGLHPMTLRNILAAGGLIPAEPEISAYHLFDAEAGRNLAAPVPRAITVSTLDEALGCTRPVADQLLNERLLLPLADGPKDSAGRMWKSVGEDAVAKLIADLHAPARPVATVPSGMVTISKAAEKSRALCIEIIHLILGGFLENIARLQGVHGIAAVLVDPAEVRAAVAAHMPGLSANTVFGKLRIPKATGWALVDRQVAPRLPSTVIEGRGGRHRFHRFDAREVVSFMSEFTTAVRIANEHDLEREDVISRLKSRGVRPVVSQSEVGVDFYKVARLPEFSTA